MRGVIEQVKRDGCLYRLTFTYVVVDFLFRVHIVVELIKMNY